MGTNERSDKLIVGLLAVLFALLLWVGLMVRDLRPDRNSVPMTRTTEWTAPDGSVETFTSTRERGQRFDVFREIHEQAVRELRQER